MTTLDNEYLIQLLREGESDRVEFKESLRGDAPNRIREAICTFANDLPDHRELGVVFVGVRDEGTPVGLSVTDELLRQLADMKTDGKTVPPPSLTVEKRSICGKDLAIVTVQPSDSPPVRYDGRAHVRIGSRREIATAQDERILNEKRRFGDIPFDIQPIRSATLSDLDLTQFENEYLPQAFAQEVLEANDRTREEQLAATKMIASAEEPVPTVLGMLVLGKRTLYYLPGAYVQFLRIAGSDVTGPITDEQAISGTITDVLRRLDEKLNSHNRTSVDITSGPVERRKSTYPVAAIQQITRNAVMHRSYEGNNAPVRVYWYDDRIEIISSGGVFGSVTAENFGQPGVTAYRNPNLAEAMRNLGFVQRFGLGIPLAKRLLREAGHPEIGSKVDSHNVLMTIHACTEED
ncbi:MAG: putative DNA binding domain-containing protein [Chloroflexota bacterium]|nr:putative DNA binding domain-containing protein [Chloroflexota bacterium]